MKTLNTSLFIVSLIIIVSGCANMVKVSHGNTKVKGIPFYVKKQVIRQETKYLHWWYEISLVSLEKAGDKIKTEELAKRSVSTAATIQDLDKLMINVANHNAGIAGALSTKDILKQLENLPAESQPFSSNPTVTLISNSLKREVIVDYNDIYYINGTLPWFGTGSFTQKLNTDGTISETTGEAETKITEFITSILPIKELLSAVLIPTGAGLLPSPETLKLVIEQKGHVYTFTTLHCAESMCDKSGDFAPLDFNLKNQFSIQAWEQSSAPAKVETDDTAAIKVSGTIQMPTEKK